MLLKSQSWFCVNRWTDLLVDLSKLIEVYLIYAHPNFHSYSNYIQFNIHLLLKSTQKLQKLSCGNTFSSDSEIPTIQMCTLKPAWSGLNKKHKSTHVSRR